jgi:hypothetical protein
MRHPRPLILVVAAAVIATACLEPSPFIPRIEDTTFDPSLGVDLAASTRTEFGVYYRDIIVGDGAIVPASDSGDTIVTRYTGYLRNGAEFDSNEDPGDPLFLFVAGTSGSQRAISGYDQGVRGMRVGGQRQLIIPPQLGYGGIAQDGIPPYSILVFTVTLVRIGEPVIDPAVRVPAGGN